MAKQRRPSLESVAGTVAPQPPRLVKRPAPAPIVPPRPPAGRAHTSIYISRKVGRMLRRIAFETERERAHDVMLEAIDDVLVKYGKPTIREIDGQ